VAELAAVEQAEMVAAVEPLLLEMAFQAQTVHMVLTVLMAELDLACIAAVVLEVVAVVAALAAKPPFFLTNVSS
jgi:hypothetical protein